MATIRRFEDLKSWQKARQLANAIYDLTEQPRFAKDFKLRDQIQGAGGSVMHNIAEGSASETQSELYLALDRKYITLDQLNGAYNFATEAKKLINALIAYLRRHKPPSTE